jgi:transcriptional regulator with XRE-family HTH domain
MGNDGNAGFTGEGGEYARVTAQAFGARIRELRNARGLSQERLAGALSHLAGSRSYSQATIAKLEAGSRPTSVEELYLLALILDVEVVDFFTESDAGTRRHLGYLLEEMGRIVDEMRMTNERTRKLTAEYEQVKARYDEAMRRAEGRD